MSNANKFGITPFSSELSPKPRRRNPGPMGAAVREAAEDLQESTEAKVDQRRRNADDAKTYRAAMEEGLMLLRLPVGNIRTDDLPRDRLELDAVAGSDAMEELKASIRAGGQKEPIEVYVDDAGAHQLKKGWRRLTALTQLYAETGDVAFGEVIARVEVGQGDRIDRYIDMVEENVVREDLTFAEMAQVAITAAQDSRIDGDDPLALVNRLYNNLHKVKRSYIRSFVTLLIALGDSLRWPKAVSRNLGVDAARSITSPADALELAASLRGAVSEEDQNRRLLGFVEGRKAPIKKAAKVAPKQKFEFHVGQTKVTARNGECRIVSKSDFAAIDKDRLMRAVTAFEAALKE